MHLNTQKLGKKKIKDLYSGVSLPYGNFHFRRYYPWAVTLRMVTFHQTERVAQTGLLDETSTHQYPPSSGNKEKMTEKKEKANGRQLFISFNYLMYA